jgi:hypothetical protein
MKHGAWLRIIIIISSQTPDELSRWLSALDAAVALEPQPHARVADAAAAGAGLLAVPGG